ncbi:cytochrome c biogenesis protein CcsA [Pseudoalteromonas luteoviolacea]|uniref:Membrane protein n=1 Tax=Pseudoalteromonas luteoviolacea H33 TaxID=1365251 RepID=A0A167G5Q6_9GAMM|nr:cytochrome c biogenesis protein CcsA [Pseudoalteromonas luteoviolacea]KZN54136.1 membrane protein [Pseudoalteromonas luteoviolacea H33]KZN78333.1 membrane protein [Pseudoalteromonas luteoviolacea H33-S]MBQ4877417.1 cytochrome c biogenesis protein CcsA [Pseudoalteromonas luteoviolacea]MBQ4906484.1 cytochrome c biogenesis protein CcsA [Pseudoalteromonas luteoviolacea]MCF6438281.1 cytochrome c biogenesis protein CcsA [Pseudoalteromonas luteoviolacea]
MIIILSLLASLFYILATGHVLSRLFHREGPSQKLTVILSTVAILSHMLVLVNSVFTQYGQDLSTINIALLTCWVIVVSVTTVSLKFPATLLLPVVYGFAAILLIASLFIPHHIIMDDINVDIGLVTHISLSLLAYCILIIATLYAVQFYFIDKRLKSKDLAIMNSHLPPLMQVESQLYQLLTVGTGLLTLALIAGFVFLDGMFDKASIHKTVLSLIAWTIFSSVTLGHHQFGWRGKPVVFAIIGASGIVTLAYFGSRFIQEVILDKF